MIIVRYLDPHATPTTLACGNRVSEARFPSPQAARVFRDAWSAHGGLCVETEDVPDDATPLLSVIGGHTVATYDTESRARDHADQINNVAGFDAVAVGSAPPHNPSGDAIGDLTASALG